MRFSYPVRAPPPPPPPVPDPPPDPGPHRPAATPSPSDATLRRLSSSPIVSRHSLDSARSPTPPPPPLPVAAPLTEQTLAVVEDEASGPLRSSADSDRLEQQQRKDEEAALAVCLCAHFSYRCSLGIGQWLTLMSKFAFSSNSNQIPLCIFFQQTSLSSTKFRLGGPTPSLVSSLCSCTAGRRPSAGSSRPTRPRHGPTRGHWLTPLERRRRSNGGPGERRCDEPAGMGGRVVGVVCVSIRKFSTPVRFVHAPRSRLRFPMGSW